MPSSWKYFSILFLLSGFPSLVAAADKVSAGKDGIYWKEYREPRSFGYAVDTVTQQCYAYFGQGGFVSVDCEKLAKRPEWKAIITWLSAR